MYQLLSIITGLLICVMISINGGLSSHYGVWFATFIIHLMGLCLILLSMLLKQNRLKFPHSKLPLYCYLGGTVGILTTLFNNMAFGKISVSAILSLGLLGQCIISLVIDRFGWLGMPVRQFSKMKYVSLVIISIGIAVMLIY